ncbi:MAG: hypothetical protein CFE44_04460 [Burkholderiales bacterium PBB4]|nr:MAG: hypothetical protein CFE44_04460 [Burkholderiales bacterium PBB4]
MRWLNKLSGFQRSASGLEWTLWKRMPGIALAGTVLPLLVVGLAYTGLPESPSPAELRSFTLLQYTVVGVVVLHWTLVVTVTIGCMVVMVMKGPAYVADAYPLPVEKGDVPGANDS